MEGCLTVREKLSRSRNHSGAFGILLESISTAALLITSAEGGYVFTSVCLYVCVSVRRITEKAVNGFWRNFLEG